MSDRSLLVFALMASAGGALAEGVPSLQPLSYSGSLLDAGVPVDGARGIVLTLWDDPLSTDAARRVCTTLAGTITVVKGRYRVPLHDACAAAVRANPDLYVEVSVDGTSLGRRKLSAVPYSLEAGNATKLGGSPLTAVQLKADPLDASKLAGTVPDAALPVIPTNKLPARVPLLDPGTNLIPSIFLPSAAGGATRTVSDSATDLAIGACKTVVHGFDSLAIFYQVWMSEGSTWVPMTATSRDGSQNIALGRAATASSQYSDGNYRPPGPSTAWCRPPIPGSATTPPAPATGRWTSAR